MSAGNGGRRQSNRLQTLRKIPARQLPFEIYSEIFLLYLADEGSVFTLAAVSRYWRNICLNNGRLWSRVKLDLSGLSDGPHSEERLKTILDRSESSLLDVTLIYEQSLRAKPSLSLFRILIDTGIHRWRTLQVFCRGFIGTESWMPHNPFEIFSEEELGFSNLTSLRIDYASEIGPDPLKPLWALLLCYPPKLTILAFQTPNRKTIRALNVFHSRLIDLQIPFNEITAFSGPLRTFPNLRFLRFGRPSWGTPRDHNTYEFPRLEYLSTMDINPEELQLMVMPKLISLKISFPHSTPRGQITFPSLRTLEWNSIRHNALLTITAPQLQNLIFSSENEDHFTSIYYYQREPLHARALKSLPEDFWKSVPASSITVEWKIPTRDILQCLEYCPEVTSFTFTIGTTVKKQKLARALTDHEFDADGSIIWKNSPKLERLKLIFDWNHTERDPFIRIVQSILSARKGSAMKSICCVWKNGIVNIFD